MIQNFSYNNLMALGQMVKDYALTCNQQNESVIQELRRVSTELELMKVSHTDNKIVQKIIEKLSEVIIERNKFVEAIPGGIETHGLKSPLSLEYFLKEEQVAEQK